MTPWKQELELQLSQPGAPAALPLAALASAANIARGNIVPDPTLYLWITDAVARGRLLPVIRGLYLNRFTVPAGRLADAVPFVRPDGVVSLHSALDEAGVFNNPPAGVTAVVPIDAGPTRPRVGVVKTKLGPLIYRAIPRKILEAGSVEDRLDLNNFAAHPQATPEKALLDWLYLANSPRSTLAFPAQHDIDVDALDSERLSRLAKAMRLQDALSAWLPAKPHRRPSAKRPLAV